MCISCSGRWSAIGTECGWELDPAWSEEEGDGEEKVKVGSGDVALGFNRSGMVLRRETGDQNYRLIRPHAVEWLVRDGLNFQTWT